MLYWLIVNWDANIDDISIDISAIVSCCFCCRCVAVAIRMFPRSNGQVLHNLYRFPGTCTVTAVTAPRLFSLRTCAVQVQEILNVAKKIFSPPRR